MASSSPDNRGKMTVSESMKQLCLSEKFADVKFLFRGNTEKLHAHRNILSMRSPVFEAMLYGPLSGDSAHVCEVTIEDTDQETFSKFLRFFYTDDIDLDGASVLKILYLANKYNLDILEEKCSTFLKSCINVKNVCTIHEHAGIFGQHELQERCFDFITDHNEEVLKSDDFLTISKETFGRILATDNLSASEKFIFDAAIRWAKQQCNKNQTAATTQNIRQQLGDNLFSIRFPLIPMDVFANEVCPSQILTTMEQLQLLKYMATAHDVKDAGEEIVGRFVTRVRKGNYIEVSLEQGDDSLQYRGGRRVVIRQIKLTVRPSHAVNLHTIVFKDRNFVSRIHHVTTSESVNAYPNAFREAEQVEGFAHEAFETTRPSFESIENKIVFNRPIGLDRPSEILIIFSRNIQIQGSEQTYTFQRHGLNIEMQYNPSIFEKIIFLP